MKSAEEITALVGDFLHWRAMQKMMRARRRRVSRYATITDRGVEQWSSGIDDSTGYLLGRFGSVRGTVRLPHVE